MSGVATIALEILVALPTQTKLFCTCPTKVAVEGANRTICPRCAGLPGTLPVLNKQALELAVKAGLLLGCQVCEHSAFQRRFLRNPTTAKNYQVGQFKTPVCTGGTVQTANGPVRVQAVGLVERLGDCMPGSSGEWLLDYNRAGQAMLLITTELDCDSAEQAVDAVGRIAALLELGRICRFQSGQYAVTARIARAAGDAVTIREIPTMDLLARFLREELARQTGPACRMLCFDPVQERLLPCEGDGDCFVEPDLCDITLSAEQVERLRAELA